MQEQLLDNVDLLPFKFKHLCQLHDILNSQKYLGISEIKMKTLPKIGYIALLNKQPIAAGFLRRVEPSFAQIDTLCSNAMFGSKIRHIGITKVVDALLQDAKSLKLDGILALTKDEGTINRALSLGFHIVDQKVIGLMINKES